MICPQTSYLPTFKQLSHLLQWFLLIASPAVPAGALVSKPVWNLIYDDGRCCWKVMMVMKSFAWVVSKQAGHCLQGMKGRRCAGARSIFATSERSSWSGLTEKLSLLRLSLTALSPLEKSIFKLEVLCNLLWRSAWSFLQNFKAFNSSTFHLSPRSL